jgi:dTDP-4-amino-4,6-dideoxygalactose transaminase
MNYYNFRPHEEHKSELVGAFERVLDSGQFIGGAEVEEFEGNFRKYTSSHEAAACGNGLDALTLIIRNLDLPSGSKIAVSGHTFFATWLSILSAGHIPIGIDTSLENLQMCPLELTKALNGYNIAAVVYVHMHGLLGEIEEIVRICNESGVPLVEDCAQAHGLKLNEKHVGTFGDFGAFSFYPTKNLPALGDAGMVISKQSSLAKIRSFANYGWTNQDRISHENIGMNSRLDTLQAALLNVNLTHLVQLNLAREQIAMGYLKVLQHSKEIKSFNFVGKSVWHHFPILVPNRDEFQRFMIALKVPTQIHYPMPCHRQPAYINSTSNLIQASKLKNTELVSGTIVSLPIHPWMKDEEITLVQDSLKKWVSKSA